MFVLRQLEFGLFDFRLHHHFDPTKANQILDTLKAVKEEVAVIKGVEWARAPHSFSHIFCRWVCSRLLQLFMGRSAFS